MKIYTDDPNLPYKTTKLHAQYTKGEIDGLFGKWGIKDVFWHYDPEHNDVFVQFKIVETINEKSIELSAKVQAPIVWDHKTRNKAERPNWDISMRVMYWFLKSHLEESYLLQSSKTAAFLPHITSSQGETLEDILIPRLQELDRLKALPTYEEEKRETRKIIEAR